VRRFVPILACGTLAYASLFAQTNTAVPGMSQFTETAFGFSFWYPTAWKVMEKPVTDPTRDGWFPDARIVKELDITNPNADPEDHNNDQPPGVILEELLAPSGLTELGRSKSPSPVGMDERYFFDKKKQQWMYAQLTEAPNGAPPATYPANFPNKTIGGLPFFYGAVRGGAEMIVALDATRFLAISTMDYGGDYSHTYLAATVADTDPHAGQHASEQRQAQVIRQEAVKLRVIAQ